MKKYLLNLFVTGLLVLLVSAGRAQTITAAGSGNWSSIATWVGGVVPTSANDVFIPNNYSITVTANATAKSITFSSSGTLTVNSGFKIDVTNGVTVQNLAGSGTRVATIAGAGTINCASLQVGGTVSAITGDATTTLTSTIAALNVSGGVAVYGEDNSSFQNSSTLGISSGTIKVGGSVTMDAENDGAGSGSSSVTVTLNTGSETGTLDIAGSPAFVDAGAGSISFSANGNNATVVYSGAAQTVRPVTYRNLTLSGSGTKTLTGVSIVNNDLVLSGTATATTAAAFTVGGDLTIGAGSQLTIPGFDFDVTGNTAINGTLLSNSTTGAKTFDNVTVGSTGVFNSSVGENYSLTGSLQVDPAATFTANNGTWTFSGASTLAGKATITNADFTTSYTNNGNFTFTNLDVSGSGTIALSNSDTITVTSTLTGSDRFTQNTSGVLYFGGSTIGITNVTFSAAGNTVNYYANGAQTVRATTYSDLVLSGSGAKTVTGSTINALLSLQGTATATGTAPTWGSTTAILEYKGSAMQTTSNVEFGGTGANPTNLRIDNTNGVILNVAKQLNGTLTLTNGYLTTDATKLLTINASGNATTANGAFVNGPLSKVKNTATLFTFPVGNLTGGLRTIGVTPQNTTSTTYQATFISGDPRSVTNGTNLGSIAQISGCEYWQLSQTSGTTAARVTLSWPVAANSCGGGAYVGNVSSLIVAHHNGTNWTNEGQSGSSGTPSAGGTITSLNYLSSFSPFTLGTTNANQNPLPVMFADVRAFEKNGAVQVEWSNLTERDLVKYVVEHSTDGNNFVTLIQQMPRSNSNDKESYTALDAFPAKGANYYRIKVYEIGGKIIYSKVMKVEIGSGNAFNIYPNPVTGGQVSVSLQVKPGQYTLKVVNTAGQEVYRQVIQANGNYSTQTIDLPGSLKAGMYNMVISGADYRGTKSFILQ